MGFNLGAFAGGLAQGAGTEIDRIQRQKQVDKENSYKERGLKMQEDEASYQQQQRQRALDTQNALQEVDKQYTAPRIGPDGQLMDYVPGADQPYDAKYAMARLAAQAKAGGVDQQTWLATTKHVADLQKTGEGQMYMKALGGDPEALKVTAPKIGLDPATAKLQIDPVKGIFNAVDGTGKSVDLRRFALMNGMHDAYTSMSEDKKDVQGDAAFKSNMDQRSADTAYKQGETALLPKKGNVLDAQAANYRASAARKNAAGAGGGNDVKVSAAILKQIQTVVDRETGGKNVDPDAANYVLGKAAAAYQKTGKLPMDVVASAAKEHRMASQQVDAFMKDVKKMSDADRKAKFGVASPKEVRRLTLEKMLGPRPSLSIADPAAATDPDLE